MTTLNLVLVLILILICLLFLLRDKLIAFMGLLLNISFVLLLGLNVSALFLPGAYRGIVDRSFRNSGTYDKIVELDNTVDLNLLQEDPEDLFNEFIDLFSPKPSSDDEEEVKSEVGYFEENVYLPLVDTLANFYRSVVVLLSTIGMILIVYLSYVTSSVTTSVHLQTEVARLRERVKNLEEKR